MLRQRFIPTHSCFNWLNCRIWAGLNVDCDCMLAVSTLVVGVWKTMRCVCCRQHDGNGAYLTLTVVVWLGLVMFRLVWVWFRFSYVYHLSRMTIFMFMLLSVNATSLHQ